MRRLVSATAQVDNPSDSDISALVGGDTIFWLDIENPDDGDFKILERVFRYHPLTIEDLQVSNPRPKLNEYDSYSFLVLFTADWADDELKLRENHIYLGRQSIVTVRDDPAPELEELRKRLKEAPELTQRGLPFLFYLVVDQIVDALFPALEKLDNTTDRLEDEIVEHASPKLLSQINDIKHSVVDIRQILGAQRDVFQQLTTNSLVAKDEQLALYFRNVYDHIVRQYEAVDSLRDLLTGAMDVYLSTVSNRLNEVMQRLTVIATIFMPLSFITGFFGMNFGWLVSNIGGVQAFGLGLLLMAATVVIQLSYFKRRGWV